MYLQNFHHEEGQHEEGQQQKKYDSCSKKTAKKQRSTPATKAKIPPTPSPVRAHPRVRQPKNISSPSETSEKELVFDEKKKTVFGCDDSRESVTADLWLKILRKVADTHPPGVCHPILILLSCKYFRRLLIRNRKIYTGLSLKKLYKQLPCMNKRRLDSVKHLWYCDHNMDAVTILGTHDFFYRGVQIPGLIRLEDPTVARHPQAIYNSNLLHRLFLHRLFLHRCFEGEQLPKVDMASICESGANHSILEKCRRNFKDMLNYDVMRKIRYPSYVCSRTSDMHWNSEEGRYTKSIKCAICILDVEAQNIWGIDGVW